MAVFRSIALLICVMNAGCATTKIADCAVTGQPTAVVMELAKHDAPPQFTEVERRLDTRLDYHLLALDADELVDGVEGATRHAGLAIGMPIYVLGIEKVRGGAEPHVDRTSCTGRDYDLTPLSMLSKKARDAACQVMQDANPMLLTHIVRFDGIEGGRLQESCSLFNAYHDRRPCPGTDGGIDRSKYNYDEAVRSLTSLRDDLTNVIRVRRPTHILIMSTGWNTQQDESVFNYLDWLDVLSSAARETGTAFRPLVVSLTWESGWDKFIRGAGVVTKGNDADEIGLTWANRLLHDVVLPVAGTVPTVLIGHSYGTRILGTALYRSDAIRTGVDRGSISPHAFIALQGAFPVQRFEADSGAEPLFATSRQPDTLTVITASRHDLANGKLKSKGIYAGSGSAIDQVRNKGTDGLIRSIEVDSTGTIGPNQMTRPGIYLADASSVVSCAMPNTGGGAHSDVYDREIGRMMWQVIEASSTGR